MSDEPGLSEEPDRHRTRSDQEQALLEHASEMLFLVDMTGEILSSVGPPLGPLGFGRDEEGTPVHIAERVHPDDLLPVLELIERVRATPGMSGSIRARARHKDGRWRIIEAMVKEASADPRLRGAVLRTRDITALVTDQGDPGDCFHSLAEAVPSGILSADSLGWVVFSNEAARQILDLPDESLLGRGWESVIHPEDQTDVVTAARSVLGSSPGEQVTFRVRSHVGERWVHARFVPLRPDPEATPLPERAPVPEPRREGMGWIAALEDITDRRRMESQLAHRATHDPLTGLPNRALLEDRLQQACARLTRGGEPAAVLFLDLDDFKEVNDRYDHHTGDQVLAEVARRLRQVLRPADTVARFGGDEFVVVCENIGPEEATAIGARIVEVLRVPFLVKGKVAEVGASIGIACTNDPSIDPTELLLRADQAMYRQKNLQVADPDADEVAVAGDAA